MARECQSAGLGVLMVGLHQPPMRLGALRVLHSCQALDKACLFEDCKHPHSCSLNHVDYYKDRKGYHADLCLVHFKNEALKGEQRLPLSPKLLEVFMLLEQAAAFTGARCLFHNTRREAYPGPYFSTVVAGLLTFKQQRCTANTFRHMFTTAWRDFTSSPHTKLLELTVQDLEAATADLMLNSTDAWNATYDDSTRARGMLATLALWPKFQEFVKEQHTDLHSQEPWDPLATALGQLSLDD